MFFEGKLGGNRGGMALEFHQGLSTVRDSPQTVTECYLDSHSPVMGGLYNYFIL